MEKYYGLVKYYGLDAILDMMKITSFFKGYDFEKYIERSCYLNSLDVSSTIYFPFKLRYSFLIRMYLFETIRHFWVTTGTIGLTCDIDHAVFGSFYQ